MNPPISGIGETPSRVMERLAGSAGFTLLELLVVLALIGMMAWLGGPSLGQNKSPRPEIVIRDFAAALREARVKAMTTGQPVSFWMDMKNRVYGMEGSKPHALPQNINVELEVAGTDRTGTKGQVKFYPGGGATGGKITLQTEDRKATVEIDWLDGGVHRVE